MAIRRPSISSPDWLFQDFLYQSEDAPGGSELRYLQIKWDDQPFTQVSQSFDYSNPPYVGPEQKGGPIVGQIDYELNASTRLVTIYAWNVNWRDEWPLRLGVTYLTQCLYAPIDGYTVRVAGNEVYTSAGDAIEDPNNFPYAFWVSEGYDPLTNSPNDYLVRTRPILTPGTSTPILFGVSSDVVVTYNSTYILATITSTSVPLQTPLYWRMTGDIDATYLINGFTEGVITVNDTQEFLELPLVVPYPAGLTSTIEFYSDTAYTNLVGSTVITL